MFVSFGIYKCNLWTHPWAHRIDNTAYFCLDCFLDREAYEWLNTGAWKTLEYRSTHFVSSKRIGNEDWTIEEFLTSPIETHRIIAHIFLEKA